MRIKEQETRLTLQEHDDDDDDDDVSIIIQHDATIYSLFISANCSTCFGCYLHPSSGAHITVFTVSGISETVNAICRERDWMGTTAPDDGWRYHPKHVEQFADINKLYTVASRWIIIDTYYAMLGPLNIISYCNCATSFYGLNLFRHLSNTYNELCINVLFVRK